MTILFSFIKTLLPKAKSLIERGALRIFPLPFTLRSFLFALAIALTVLTVYSCASTRPVTQLVRDIQRDTIYIASQQYDSIYIYQDRLLDRSKDTVYLKDVSVEYRYKLLRDTVKVIQRDSIPYEVTVVETKEITRPLTFFDHLTRAIFWILATFLFVQFVRFVVKLKHPYSF